MRIRNLSAAIVVSLALAACGGGGGGGGAAIVPPVTQQSSITTNSTGATTASSTISVAGATVNVPGGTTLTTASGTPVTGTVNVVVTYGTSATFLPPTLQVAPANTTMKAYLDIVMTAGGATVKNVNPPIPVAMNVPLPNGTAVDIYSHGSETGALWVKEGTKTVFNGAVSFNVTHFSTWAVFQQNLTGLTGGTNGGTVVQ
jgi:hypothetical protein